MSTPSSPYSSEAKTAASDASPKPKEAEGTASSQDTKKALFSFLPRYTDGLDALQFLTCLPVDGTKKEQKDGASQPFITASMLHSFPLIGFLLGGVAGLFLLLLSFFGIPYMLACLLALAFMVLVTGGLHEDGLADVADSLHGHDPQQRHDIMKDSHIGVFGVLGVFFALSIKWGSLVVMEHSVLHAFQALVAAACLSRATIATLPYFLEPIHREGLGASMETIDMPQLIATLVMACLLTLFVLARFDVALVAIGSVAVVTFLFIRFAERYYGGYNGDLCGACQQVTEITTLIACAMILQHIP